jgi:peptidoglycan/LPS O-acetylase OafA/YrhL
MAPAQETAVTTHPPTRIKGLDGLRFVAVSLVFLHHRTGLGAYDVGVYGVWMFFVLSGFLIINILHVLRQSIEAGTVSVRSALGRFLARRSLRIFPIYYLTLVATAPLFLHGHDDAGRRFMPAEDLFNVFYLSNVWIGNVVKGFVGPFSHLWSLSIEEQFYILASVALLLIPSRRSGLFCALVCFAGLAVKLVLEARGAPAISLYTNSLINFTYIAAGGLFILSLKTPYPADGRSNLTAPLALATYLALPFLLHALGVSAQDRRLSQYAPLLIGVVLVGMLKNQRQWLVLILDWRPLRALGKISYGIYLYHNFITYDIVFKAVLRTVHVDLGLTPSEGVAVSAVLTLLVSAASFVLIERPLLRLAPGSREVALRSHDPQPPASAAPTPAGASGG